VSEAARGAAVDTTAGPDAAAAATDILASAFVDDPMIGWVFPDAARRPAALDTFFAANVRYAALYGRVDLAPGGDGAAIWLAPGDYRMTAWRMLRSGHALLPLRLGPSGWRRLQRLNAYALMQHARTVTGPHWYLYGVGVLPAGRGRGIGTALLRLGLDRADRDRLPCYLETASEQTLPLYTRLGFRVAIPGRFPADGPPYWAMLRPARVSRPQSSPPLR
jgi:ribosomal protein S18 acetylase RimI-like enzyme